MSEPLLNATEPFDSRIEIVLALLNQRREFARRGAEALFSRREIADLLKLSGDPWTAALLAELGHARRRAEAIAAQTPYSRVVTGLLGEAQSHDASLRLMRRAVTRPIERAMLQAQDLLARIQADKMPLTAAASEHLDAQLLALQQAWTQYSDRLLSAYLRLRESPVQAGLAQSGAAPAQPSPKSPSPAPTAEAAGEPRMNRRRSDREPLLH